jgi:hypothetical protein
LTRDGGIVTASGGALVAKKALVNSQAIMDTAVRARQR